MNKPTFEAFQDQLIQLYDKAAYAEAFELALRDAKLFPEHEQETYYWRMCLAARTNAIPQALQFFQDALAHGHWFPPQWLQDDDDLQPLQGLPAYEQMVAVCRQKLAEVQASVQPELLIIHPDEQNHLPAQPYPLLLALHGNTDNALHTVDFWRSVTSQGWMVAVPQSSQVIGPEAYVWNDWEKATQEVQEHYAALTRQYAIDPERAVLGGFSKGGGLAVWMAMSGMVKVRGFVVLGPYLGDVDALQPFIATAKEHGLRGYIVIGEQDKGCLEIAQKTAHLLRSHNIPCELELRPDLGHTYPPDFAQSLERALAFILQK